MVVFFDRREKKQFFQGKQMFFSEFFCPRHNVFQPEGYIFLVFHPLTYHKPLHFDGFQLEIVSCDSSGCQLIFLRIPPMIFLGIQECKVLLYILWEVIAKIAAE